MAVVIATELILGASLTLTTVMLNAGRLALRVPSLTLITIPFDIPISALVGVPVNAPVAGSNVAHVGLLVILKVNVSPAVSVAVGIKL